MSKYSPKERVSRKLEASQSDALKKALLPDDLSEEQIKELTPDRFELAGYDEAAAERTGYSNYSYWGATVRMFFKNKTAVAMLIIMLVLVIFTFIQPLLPNQFDSNVVNYYDKQAVWITVDEDSVSKMEGIKHTKGDYAVEIGENETLAYVRVPDSWGDPHVFVAEAGGEREEVTLTKDPKNPDWSYVLVNRDKAYMYIYSEDMQKTTYYQAVWITMNAENLGVYSSSTKQTSSDVIEDIPEGKTLVYIQPIESFGVPKIVASAFNNGSDGEDVELMPVDGDDGWYYGFVPAEKYILKITSEDGTQKALNKGMAKVTDPTQVIPLYETEMTKFIINKSPDDVFWFGTNDIGQDLWARMWSGTRTSLEIGIIVAAIEAVIGILAGLLWGYVRALDWLFTEIYNLIDNIPTTIVLILASYIMRPSMKTIIIAMSITGWIGLARFIRNQVLIIRDRDFNLASRCLGTPTGKIILKNLLPQMVSVVMLRMALAIPGAIGSEVFLAYIGLGLPIDTPSLGNLINKGRSLMMAPTLRYQLIIPAIVLSVITICFYLVGNAFADAADPRNHV